MKLYIPAAALAVALIAGGATAAQAGKGGGQGASGFSPGHQMQVHGSVPGHPGASGYAPGQRKKVSGAVRGHPGASGYAPGHLKKNATIRTRSTTGSAVRF